MVSVGIIYPIKEKETRMVVGYPHLQTEKYDIQILNHEAIQVSSTIPF